MGFNIIDTGADVNSAPLRDNFSYLTFLALLADYQNDDKNFTNGEIVKYTSDPGFTQGFYDSFANAYWAKPSDYGFPEGTLDTGKWSAVGDDGDFIYSTHSSGNNSDTRNLTCLYDLGADDKNALILYVHTLAASANNSSPSTETCGVYWELTGTGGPQIIQQNTDSATNGCSAGISAGYFMVVVDNIAGTYSAWKRTSTVWSNVKTDEPLTVSGTITMNLRATYSKNSGGSGSNQIKITGGWAGDTDNTVTIESDVIVPQDSSSTQAFLFLSNYVSGETSFVASSLEYTYNGSTYTTAPNQSSLDFNNITLGGWYEFPSAITDFRFKFQTVWEIDNPTDRVGINGHLIKFE